ncbi:DUF2971 domain-containing protein [Chitinophaga sp. S165]|uniref:DUF2971 domain-containing protein n=1 Tax=Chitinophaga sp. S165 TaxID=2135462 RepID=UPI000D98525D|nr:DUF2971 domain-containing protein [Chitinophaga sp. S165]PWV45922.1 hypothetical protein C7475_112140 [Chitinophaga sp. S165]
MNQPRPADLGTLYKYRIWNDKYAKKTLTDSEVFLSSPDQFNDPFDATFPFRYKEEDLTPDNIFKKLYELGKREWPEMKDEELHQLCYERQMSVDFTADAFWMDEYPSWKADINAKFGILCLTKSKDNLLMWSHYGDSHRGFCVGFNPEILFDCIQGQLGPVIYSNDFPVLGLFDNTQEGLTRILCTKSEHWQYEDEHRFVKIDGSRKIIKLPDEAITEIILGCNMPDAFKKEIILLADQKFPGAKIFEATVDLKAFKLNMIPIIRAVAA